MIKLQNITKTYSTDERKTEALRGISLETRKSEFMCVLGPSGCGKTTLLNILGGLDRFTTGDMFVDGKSTADFTDEDWDAYRSRKVGFVFQNYNLIPHQTVLENVETALAISGVGKEERRKRSIEALSKVGLSEHLRKKPSQLSGGEAQRVAIARALVNNPDTILADEPTGALDSENSAMIMDILKEISKDRLVATVTHNDELARKYATRTIRMFDGRIASDSNPYSSAEAKDKGEKPSEQKSSDKKKKRTSMSYGLAARLSLKNLFGKKVRTFLTSAAAAVAVLGIALVVACSNGLNAFVVKAQRDSMSAFPITVSNSYVVDFSLYINQFVGSYGNGGATRGNTLNESAIVSSSVATPKKGYVMINRTLREAAEYASATKKAIDREYVDYVNANVDRTRASVTMERRVAKNIYKSVNMPTQAISSGIGKPVYGQVNMLCSTASEWTCLPNDRTLVDEQYEVVCGKYPTEYNELALVVDKNSSITDALLTTFFLDVYAALDDKNNENYVDGGYKYEDFVCLDGGESKYGVFNLVLNDEYYENVGDGKFYEKKISLSEYINKLNNVQTGNPWAEDSAGALGSGDAIVSALKQMLGADIVNSVYCYDEKPSDAVSIPLKIACVLKLKDDAQYGMLASPVCYTDKLNDFIIGDSANSKVVAAQKNSDEAVTFAYSYSEKKYVRNGYTNSVTALENLGYAELPTKIKFYPNTIADKDYLVGVLDAFNYNSDGTKKDVGDQIRYVDNVSAVMSLVDVVVGGLTGVLVALTAVSLLVSSIMIGIITYVSVLERVKEIGVLRAVGARKKDVARLFFTETAMIGAASGLIGLIAAAIAQIPLNAILESTTGIGSIIFLSWYHVLGLFALSVAVTVVAGLIPSLFASRQDPVKALRSE